MNGARVTVKEAWAKFVERKGYRWCHRPCPPIFLFSHTTGICIMPTASSFDSSLATETDKGVASLVNLRSGQFWLTRSACFLLTRLMEQYELMGKGVLIPADVTYVHKMFPVARSKLDWCTELGKEFTMGG